MIFGGAGGRPGDRGRGRRKAEPIAAPWRQWPASQARATASARRGRRRGYCL